MNEGIAMDPGLFMGGMPPGIASMILQGGPPPQMMSMDTGVYEEDIDDKKTGIIEEVVDNYSESGSEKK